MANKKKSNAGKYINLAVAAITAIMAVKDGGKALKNAIKDLIN